MYRREFLKASGLGAAATVLPSAGMAAQDESAAFSGQRLSVASAWPAASQGLADQAWQLAKRIETLTGGMLAMDLQAGVSFTGSSLDTADYDALIVSDGNNVTVDPAFGFFAGLPGKMGLSGQAMQGWLTAGGGADLWDELAARFGWKALLAGHSGAGAGLWLREPFDSFAGRTIAADGLAADVARGLGARPVKIDHADMALALSEDRVDAVEPASLAEAMALRLPAAARHVLDGGIFPYGTTLALYVRLDVWHRLPANCQRAIEAASTEQATTSVMQQQTNTSMMRRALAQSYGIAWQAMSPDMMLAVDRISEAVVADLSSRDSLSRRIADSSTRFRSRFAGV